MLESEEALEVLDGLRVGRSFFIRCPWDRKFSSTFGAILYYRFSETEHKAKVTSGIAFDVKG